MGYESTLRVHLAAYFADRPLERVRREDVEGFAAWMRAEGRSPKTTRNSLGLLHSIFDHAQRRRWVTANPCKGVDMPRSSDADADIRFLDRTEVEAVVAATTEDPLRRVERVLYVAAATTGLRQGELFALRWSDVDWLSRRVRVRRFYVCGEFGAPKSKRSTRSVPLADRLGAELDGLHRATPHGADDDLVFAHLLTGRPLDRSSVLKRYKAALKRAGIRKVRFHDLRHTFGTLMAAQGVPMRTLQEWMGHRDLKTTLIYADYAPGAREAEWVNVAFGGAGINPGINPSESQKHSDTLERLYDAE